MATRNKTPLSPLALHMHDDLTLSGKRPKTVKAYVSGVRQLARYYDQSPDALTEDQVRAWLVHLVDKKNSPPAPSSRSSPA